MFIISYAVALIAHMFLGAYWYSESGFANMWLRAMPITHERIAQIHPTKGSTPYVRMVAAVAVQTLILSFLISVDNLILSWFVAFILWLGFQLPPIITHVAFSEHKEELILIDGGYYLVGLLLSATILTVSPF
eukprot:ANDGO_00226.mRNA.1 hypothetical protein